jgi:two-component system sensor histidine kinase BarA
MVGLIFIVLCNCALAQSTLQLINKDQVTRLSHKVKILQEQGEPLSIQDVRKKKTTFKWHTSSNPNYGFQAGGLWLHTSFSRVTNIEEWVIDIGYTHLERADFYLLSGSTIIASSQQGKLSKTQLYRYPSFKVALPLATPLDLFVRLESNGIQVIAPIDIQPYSVHVRSMFWDNLLWGIFYGGLLALLIYNLVMYFGNKDNSLLAYVNYIIAVIIWQFFWGGHSVMLLPFNITLWFASHIDLIFIYLGIASGVFSYTFLDAKHSAPKSSPFVKISIGSLAITGFFSIFNLIPTMWQNSLVYLLSLSAIVSYLVAGAESYFNKFKPARYFILAWTVLALAAVAGMLSLTGVLPTNGFTSYCFQVGVFIEAGLFSLAIMDKSRNQLEKDIHQATNDIRTNMEFIEEQNARLDIARKDAINASTIKSQFLANMSHEIRTPLNAILGFSKELIHTPLPINKQEHVRIINSAADSLLTIVNDVLDVSKIEAGKLQVNRQPFSPNVMLEEMVSVMAKSAHQKNLEFHFELSALPEKLIGDAHRIKQILTNLLGNALKFTPSGHIGLRVEGEYFEHDLFELKFSIDDTGIGINQHDRQKLFTPFTQLDDATSRSYQGTGLGLMICKQLVHLMGGKIALTSTPDKGSCFTVTILVNVLNKSENIARNIGWNKKQVLMLTTEDSTSSLTAKMIELAGAEVTTVDNLTELHRLKHKFSAVFVALPRDYLQANPDLLTGLINANIASLVLLYSGPDLVVPQDRPQSNKIVSLRLPLTLNKMASLLATPEKSKHQKLHQDLLSLPPIKVLAVDDMEMNLRLLMTWFKPSKLELSLCYSGEDAVELCQQQEFDLILMDVQMPNMDGLQASRLIRKTNLNIGTPIIAVTAHALKEEQDRLLASGMDDYLPKPLDLAELIVLIRQWCGRNLEGQLTPSVDWSVALTRANHNEEAAKEVFTSFIEQLPKIKADITQSWQQDDKALCLSLIHKLHGACCYTGVPNLRELCNELETALKNQQYDTVELRLPEFLDECDRILIESEMFI